MFFFVLDVIAREIAAGKFMTCNPHESCRRLQEDAVVVGVRRRGHWAVRH